MREYLKENAHILAALGMGFLVVFSVFSIATWSITQQNIQAETFKKELLSEGFDVQEATFASPSIVVKLNHTDFIVKAHELNATVYQVDRYYFYILEPNLQIAYRTSI